MKDSFKYQTAADAAEIAAFLQALAEGVRSGRLPVSEGERTFVLNPRGLTDLHVKVRRKAGRAKVSLELTWAEDFIPAPGERDGVDACSGPGAEKSRRP